MSIIKVRQEYLLQFNTHRIFKMGAAIRGEAGAVQVKGLMMNKPAGYNRKTTTGNGRRHPLGFVLAAVMLAAGLVTSQGLAAQNILPSGARLMVEPPIANNDSYSTDEDVPLVVGDPGVLANDSDGEGGTGLPTSAELGPNVVSNGNLTLNPNGSFTYTPNQNFNGVDDFSYFAMDGDGLSTTPATVTITVNAINDAPVAYDDDYTVETNTVLNIAAPGVLVNDTDVEGTTLTAVTPASDPPNGSVILNSNGSFNYTPDLDFNGLDTFNYQATDGTDTSNTATVSILVDLAPVLATIGPKTVNEGQTLSFIASATDNDDDILTYSLEGSVPPSATINPTSGGFSWTQTLTEGGNSYTFDVCVTDTFIKVCETITVTVNDTPVVEDIPGQTINEGSTFATITLDNYVNDAETAPANIVWTVSSVLTNFSVDIVDRVATITPLDSDWNGSETITFRATDAGALYDEDTAQFTVDPVNDAPDAVNDTPAAVLEDSNANVFDVLENDTDIDLDSLTVTGVTNGTKGTAAVGALGANVTYTPNANANGSDSFTYTISDGHSGTDTATVNVTITPANDAPDAVNDSATVGEDSGVNTIDVLLNDTDIDLDTLTVTAVTQGTKGTAAVGALGANVTYTPNANANGSDSFTYTISDGHGGTATGTVTVHVTSVNDLPVAVDDTATVVEDSGANSIDVLANDTDVETLNLTVSAVTTPTKGSVAIVDGGLSVTYTPNPDATGSDTFVYTVSDGEVGGTDTGTVSITITNVNDPPVGADNSVTILEDGTKVFSAADFPFTDSLDPTPNSLLAVKITSLPTLGTLTLSGGAVNEGDFISAANLTAGNLVFTPVAQAYGSPYTTFTFQVQDDGETVIGENTDQSANTLSVNVTLVNDPPSGADGTVTAVEDTEYPFAAAEFGFSDPNDAPSPNAFQAVQITALPAVGSLELNNGPVDPGDFINITDINAGLLTFTPDAHQNGIGYATLKFKVQDNGGGLNLDPSENTLTIDVTPVNDPPAGTDKIVTILEDGSHTFAEADFGFTDPNDDPNDAFAAVTITTLPGVGTLSLNSAAVTGGQSILAADIPSLVYAPAANGNGTGYASFTFQVQDDGGKANSGQDTDQSANTLTIDVTPVNDPPAGTDGTESTLEDTAYTFAAEDFGFTDPLDEPDHDFLAVKITSLPGAGVLALDGTAVEEDDVITVTAINSGLLAFTPALNQNGAAYAALGFKVQDGGGIAIGGVDLALSENTLTIDVTPVNDAPVGADKTVSTLEDIGYVFTSADFGFTDPADSPADDLSAVVISSLPLAGGLTLDGAGVAVDQVVSLADINAGKLVFTPALDASGAGHASFTIKVRDDGGLANDGEDTDLTARILTVDVTSLNDAPQGTTGSVSTNEDTSLSITASNFGFSDPKDSPANAFSAVKVGTISGLGTLALDGVPVAADQTISVADITANKLVFTPVLNGNGAAYASFTFQVQDDGGEVNGGVDLDPTLRTLTINVVSVNDAPAGADATITTVEDTAKTLLAADFGFSDSFDSLANSLLAVKIVSLPAVGTLKLDGAPVALNQFVSAADIALNKLVYTPLLNDDTSVSFTFQVQDDGGVLNDGIDLDPSPNTLTIDMTPVNDNPVAVLDTPTVLEDSSNNMIYVLTNDTDVDVPANTLTVSGVGVAAHGTVGIGPGGVYVVYTPVGNYFGPDTFTYTLSDGAGGSAVGTVNIMVTSVNDLPVVTTIPNQTILEGASFTTISLDGFVSDVETADAAIVWTYSGNTDLTVSIVNRVATISIPNPDWFGVETITFRATDADGGFDEHAVTFTVTNVNDVPVGAADAYFVNNQMAKPLGSNNYVLEVLVPEAGVLGNDTDADSDPLNVTLKTNVTKGTLILNSNGTFTYTYVPGGLDTTDTFVYTVSDGHGGLVDVMVTITIDLVPPESSQAVAQWLQPIQAPSLPYSAANAVTYTTYNQPLNLEVLVEDLTGVAYIQFRWWNSYDAETDRYMIIGEVPVVDGQHEYTQVVTMTTLPYQPDIQTYAYVCDAAGSCKRTGLVDTKSYLSMFKINHVEPEYDVFLPLIKK